MQLLHVDNYTPFEWFVFEKMAPRRALYDVIVVKAALPMSHSLDKLACQPNNALACTIEMADRTRQSELGAYAPLSVVGDTVIFKPCTDVYISGHAKGPCCINRFETESPQTPDVVMPRPPFGACPAR